MQELISRVNETMMTCKNPIRSPFQKCGDCKRIIDIYLLAHHHLDEFFVVDLSITVNIGFTNHFTVSNAKETMVRLFKVSDYNNTKKSSSPNQRDDQETKIHLLDFLISQFLSKVCHDVTQFSGRDKTISVLVEYLEGLKDLFL